MIVDITNLVNSYPYAGIVFTLILGAIGSPFPEDATLLLSGCLIAHGTINLFLTFLLVFPLLLITDFFVFFIGRIYRRRLVQHKRFSNLSPEKLLKLEEKFRRRGVWVVLFGRHILGLKTPLFFAAGLTRMSVTKFLILDAATAFSTVALFWGGIGLLGDNRIERLTTGTTSIGHLAMVVLLILLSSWIGYKCWKQRIKKLIPY